MSMIKRFLYIFVFLICFVSIANATGYYFSNTPVGTQDCSLGNACAGTMGAAGTIQAIIDGATEESTLYFDRGSTWSMITAAVATTTVYGFTVGSEDEIIHIDAYGSGDKPIFYGEVADFSGVAKHSASGPLEYNRIFQFNRNSCSIKNIKITGIYGIGVYLGSLTDIADYTTVEGCDITNYGTSAIHVHKQHTRHSTISKNLIHTGGQLSRYLKDSSVAGNCGWSPAIAFESQEASARSNEDNTINYNVVYDIYGEGIAATGSIIEKNLVGDTASYAIFVNPKGHDLTDDTIVRYNLLTQSSSGTYELVACVGNYSRCRGINVGDDNAAGTNSAGVEVYGNIIINKYTGLSFNNAAGISEWDFVRFYNNTVIDSQTYNISIGDNTGYNTVAAGQGVVYNNAFIFYDRDEGGGIGVPDHAVDVGNPGDFSTYWTISHNSFWNKDDAGSGYVDDDWQTNYVTGDPKLAGEEQGSPVNWDGLASGDPRSIVTFANITPNSDSSLIGNGYNPGSSFDSWLLSPGTDYTTLPSAWTLYHLDQDSLGWTIGAALSGFSIGSEYPTSLQLCGYSGEMGVTSSENANCKYSVKGADTCSTAYADLDSSFTGGEGGTAHTVTVDNTCSTEETYVVKCLDGDSQESNCIEIVMQIANATLPPHPAPVMIWSGGNVKIVGNGTVTIVAP